MNYKDYIEKNVLSFYKIGNNIENITSYTRNNWRFDTPPHSGNSLDWLYHKGGAIWLNSKGVICYRLSLNDKIKTAPIKNINILLSNFLQTDIKILSNIEVKNSKDLNINKAVNNININDLILVKNEIFEPYVKYEFSIKEDNGYKNPFEGYGYISNQIPFYKDVYYRNTFTPTSFLTLNISKDYKCKYSITLQYFYYLSNYNKDKFLYLINWIASFFQNLSDRRDTLLVLLGNKNSGKDIFFEEIINPLFGKEYCLNITDDILESKYLKKKLMNKLFYNFKNISDIKNKKSNLLKRLIYSSSFDIEDSEIKFYGQKIITIDEPYLPYIDDDYKDYVVFKVPENINAIHIPPNFLKKISNSEEFNKAKLIEHIKQDLVNFTFILRNHKVDFEILKNNINYDDKKYINHTLEDKVRTFVNAIKSGDISYFKSIEKINPELFEEIEKDYENQKIKQKNLMKCFSALNTSDDISGSRKLMKELRKNDKEYFAESKIISGSGGVKYYKFSKKN